MPGNEGTVTVLWHAIFKGELCRLRRSPEGGLYSEVWRDGSWVKGPDFAALDFTGRAISGEEAEAWIRSWFRNRRMSRCPGEQNP